MNAPTLPNRLSHFFLYFARPFRWGCLGLIFFPILGRAVSASIALAIRQLTNTTLNLRGPLDTAGRLLSAPFTLFAALVVARFVCDAGTWFCSYHTRSAMLIRIKEEVFSYAQRLSPAYFESILAGKLAHRTIMLPDQILALFDMTVAEFVPDGMFFVFIVACLYVASHTFCAAAGLGLAVYFTGSILLGRQCARRAAAGSEARAAVTGRIVDVITNVRSVFQFANQVLEDRELTEYTDEERKRRLAFHRAVVRVRCSQYVMDILMWIGFVGGALYGWVHSRLTAGDFVMVTMLTGSLLQTAYSLGQRIPDFYDQLGSAVESIETLIVPATVRDAPEASRLTIASGAIHFERITFAYESRRDGRGSQNIVHEFELYIPPGQHVGLVGPSGAGKTTLIGLLLRLYDVTEGAIRIDETDIRSVTQESLRGCISLIPQDTNLFHRSLLENIRYGRPTASDEDVIAAARRAYAHEFIVELEHGYDTLVGERGIKLSGGQRQRVAIARAILRDAPVLLLDEATSALDSHNENKIQEAMKAAMTGKTVIAIAHRLSTVMDMDRLIVLDRGVIVADGSHAELLLQGGLYAELWRKQSGGLSSVAQPERM